MKHNWNLLDASGWNVRIERSGWIFPRADANNVQRMMALRRTTRWTSWGDCWKPRDWREETGSVISYRSRHARQRRSPGCKGTKTSTWTHDWRVGQTRTLTHVVFRSWCRHCVSGRAWEDPPRRIATHEGRTPKFMLDWMFFTSDQEPCVQLPLPGCLWSFHWCGDGNAVNNGFGQKVETLEIEEEFNGWRDNAQSDTWWHADEHVFMRHALRHNEPCECMCARMKCVNVREITRREGSVHTSRRLQWIAINCKRNQL